MKDSIVISCPSDMSLALNYLRVSFQASSLVTQPGSIVLTSDCSQIKLATSFAPPPDQDFYTGCGGASEPCVEWLVKEILDYLRSLPNAVVLFEDIVSSPSDPFLNSQSHPLYWQYQSRVLWSVLSNGADERKVQQAMAARASIRILVIFSRLPEKCPVLTDSEELPDEVFHHLADSIDRLATDVFDDEGFIVWYRPQVLI